jgi:CHASE2 domain-containing sensor protein
VPEVRTAGAEPGAKGGARFDVFLSYNSRDREMVERIAERLKRSGLEPWLDVWSQTPGGEWQEELGRGIEASRACAVFVGPSDLGAWGLQELAFALDRSTRERDFRVFPVLLPGVREPFDPTVLPHFLRTRTWVDFRRGHGSDRALQDIIAAVKGVPFGPSVAIEPWTGLTPYRGLQPFGEEDATLFFGRDREEQRLVEMLKGGRFLAVVGASGSGKSSLVRAGLVPALRAGALPEVTAWTVCVLEPGADPLGILAARLVSLGNGEGMQATLAALSDDPRTLHLASALALSTRPNGERLLLVVDQLEETFTLTSDEEALNSFFDNLIFASSAAGGRCTVAVTLRSDFYPRLAAHSELAQQVSAHQFLLTSMERDGLRQVIEEPARLAGLEFESGLVETILDDVARQPGALPLLEHALLELWERRRGRMLTLEGYRESGGVSGALATRAEAIYGGFDAERKAVAQRVLLRLTQPGEGTEDTRRQATMNELVTRSEEADALEGVVGELAHARMLTVGGEGPEEERRVDVSHEALIRGWQRLRGWVEDDRAGLQVHRRLREAAQEWQRLGRDEALVHRGAQLAEAVEWRKDHEQDLNELERAFLEASLERQARQRRAASWTRAQAAAWIALAATALALSLYLSDPEPVQRLELGTVDARFSVRGTLDAPDPRIVLVAVDDRTVARLHPLGPGPLLPRQYYAQLLNRLRRDRPDVIAFDVIFEGAQDPRVDRKLLDAIRATSDRLVLAFAAFSIVTVDNVGEMQDVLGGISYPVSKAQVVSAAESNQVSREGIQMLEDMERDRFKDPVEILEALGGPLQTVRPDLFGRPEALEATGVRTGFAGLPEDEDDGNRRTDYEVTTTGNLSAQTFAFAAADLARHGALRAQDLPTAPHRTVDEQSDSTTWIDYRGPSGTVRRVSALDVLDGRVAPGTFRDKRVVVGVTAPVTSDVHDTPFDRMRGPEVQANALDTILRGAPRRDLPLLLNVLAIVLLAAAPAAATLIRRPWRAVVAVVAAAVLFLAVVQIAFNAGWIFAVVAPLTGLLVATLGAAGLALARELRPPLTRL